MVMNKKKVKDLIDQLRNEVKTCAIMVSDNDGYTMGAMRGTSIDILDNVMALIDDMIRQDDQTSPQKYAEAIARGVLDILERIEHDREMGMQSKQH